MQNFQAIQSEQDRAEVFTARESHGQSLYTVELDGRNDQRIVERLSARNVLEYLHSIVLPINEFVRASGFETICIGIDEGIECIR
jgi:hypothetical protein